MDRMITLDIMRGVALLGILIVNMAGFALPFDALNNPTLGGVQNRADYLAWFTTDLFVTNSMRGLFSLLFGASIILLTSKMEQKGDPAAAKTYYHRRNMWLLVFGLFHAYILLMPGDVLYYYALTGFILYHIRHKSPRSLLLYAGLILSIRTLIGILSYAGLHELLVMAESHGGLYQDLLQELRAEILSSPQEIQQEIAAVKGGYLSSFMLMAPFSFLLQTYGYITDLLWDVSSMMLVGMALYKLGILQGNQSRRFYFFMMAGGYLIGIGVNGFQLTHLAAQNFDLISQHRHEITFDLCRLALTLGHVGVINLAISVKFLPPLKQALAAVGRMALSNYILQTLICTTLFYGFGFGLFNEVGRADLFALILLIWILQLIASPLWLKYYRFGPMEWLWRSLTFKKIMPLRKTMPLAH